MSGKENSTEPERRAEVEWGWGRTTTSTGGLEMFQNNSANLVKSFQLCASYGVDLMVRALYLNKTLKKEDRLSSGS